MFVQSTRNKPFQPRKVKKIKTFLKFKNVEPGSIQYDELIYKVKFLNKNFYNIFYVGNIYKILKSNEELMLLQSKENEMYLVPVEKGRKILRSRIYGRFEYRTFLHYIPKIQEYIDCNDINNEALFYIEKEMKEFIAIGKGINNRKFNGYKISFVNTLKNVNQEFEEISLEEEENNEENNEKNFSENDLDFLM